MPQRADTYIRSTFSSLKILTNIIVRYLPMILLAFFLFGLIVLISGEDPIQSYKDLFTSTLGSTYGFSEVIVAMIPMLITALAVALPWRVGLINIGAISINKMVFAPVI